MRRLRRFWHQPHCRLRAPGQAARGACLSPHIVGPRPAACQQAGPNQGGKRSAGPREGQLGLEKAASHLKWRGRRASSRSREARGRERKARASPGTEEIH